MSGEWAAGRVAPAVAAGVWVRTARLGIGAGIAALTVASLALANPQGGEVVSGQATITTPTPAQTRIDQQSDKAAIDWKSFNIGKDESTVFVQPNSSSITLNRIFDNDPSIIAGLLSANGRLILINRNGMMFEGTSVVNTAGLIATTADIGNADFMAGNYKFETPGNPNAQISNAGQITAEQGGVVAFVAPSVRNSGVITAKLGRVEIGAGNTFVLDLYGDNLISFPVSAEIAQQLIGPDGEPVSALVEVDGKIEAGWVRLTARAARGIIDNVINISGEVVASGILQNNGAIFLTGEGPGGKITVDGGANGNINIDGTLNASGTSGGTIAVSGENVAVNGTLNANGVATVGGSITVAASNFAAVAGPVTANGGSSGGSVDIRANNLLSAGRVEANGANGAGGSVSLVAANKQIATAGNQVSAKGATQGGSITLAGGVGADQGLFSSGTYDATSAAGKGGSVGIQGRDIKLIDAHVDVSGATGGGDIAVGYTMAGGARDITADSILLSPHTTFKADALQSGDGGRITFWSNVATEYMSTATARGGALGGSGGLIEVSSLGEIGFWGLGDASAPLGEAGTLLLDPKNLIVSASGSSFPSYQLIDPSASAGNQFGANVAVLSTGNTVVTASLDDFAAANAGAAYVYNTVTGALVSTLTGSTANNNVGSGGITVLANGNFVVSSPNWDFGAQANAGAATWGSGVTGVSGVVSAANSLRGSTTNNQVSNLGVVALANGNYVVRSSLWDSAGNNNAGAVTWGNGATGTVGAVSAANSLIGSNLNDQIGSGGIVELTNGNFVVLSQLWNNGGVADAGAVTWANGLGGTVGVVSAANSLVGTTASDRVGSGGVVVLTNGNYVVSSQLWNDGLLADVGAITWGSGASGVAGAVSALNSLVGSTANDQIGSSGVVALTNGNYVVASPQWDDGLLVNAGAATWADGAVGVTGTISLANSLIGPQANDEVGLEGVVALTNGNYVVTSTEWNNGAIDEAGAVTWGNGATGTFGYVTAANSLVGTALDDSIGDGGVFALANGNYLVSSTEWDVDGGAITFANGATGLVGVVSIANSLIGGDDGIIIGTGGIVTLTNGNYVVVSPLWYTDGGATTQVGAVTWGDGVNGTVGLVTAANSIVGSTTDDQIGSGGVTALANGNYVISSPLWNNGAVVNAGAVTWANGSIGTSGVVSAANSLVGTVANDQIGSTGILALANGNYIVRSALWNNGAIVDAGAVTWGNGAGGTFGALSSLNSLVGTTANDQVGLTSVIGLSTGDYVVTSALWDNGILSNVGAVTLGDGVIGTSGAISANNSLIGTASNAQLNFVAASATNEVLARSANTGTVLVGLTDPNQLTFARAQGQTLTVNPAFITRSLNTGTSVSLQASNDLSVLSDIIAANPLGDGGALTLQAGRSVIINADITTDNGDLTIIANELLGAGVVNAQRDPGAAVLSMGPGAELNAGTGDVLLRIASGAGKTNTASGDMLLGGVTGNTILAENLGPSNGDVIINAGATVTATGAGTPLVLAAAGGDFINNAGALALSAPNGRWIVYSQNPANDTTGGLPGSPYYNTVYNASNPTGLAASGNRFAYTVAPVLTVTADTQTRPYGQSNDGLTYTITGYINADNPALAVSGAPSLTSTATPTSPVGSGPYPISVSLGTLLSDYNYGFTFVDGLLSITGAQLFYLADPKSRVYGDVNPALTGQLIGLVNGDALEDVTDGTMVYTTAATQLSNVGPYAITGSGLTVTNANYIVTILQDPTNATALTITPAQLTYLANAASRIYGDANPAFSGSVFGMKNGELLTDITDGTAVFTSPAVGTTPVGGAPINGSGLTVTSGNYLATVAQDAFNATALTINPAQLFYLADPASREYGNPNPLFTGQVTGLKNGELYTDVASGTLTFTSPADNLSTVAGGPYAINGSGLTVASGNYIATILQDPSNATALTLTTAQLFYFADPKSRSYGDANPALTGSVLGLKNGDTLASLASGTLTFTTAANQLSNVGSYAIDGSGLTVIPNANYSATILQHASNATALTINQAQLFYKADAKSRAYGDANPALTGTVTGLKNGHAVGDVAAGTVVFTTAADQLSNVGSYAIDGSGLAVTNTNYVATVLQDPTNATALTITPAQLFYLANPVSRVYGDPNPAFSGTVIGLKNGQTQGDVTTGAAVFTSPTDQTTNAGSHAINGSGVTVTNTNYAAAVIQDPSNATALTITPAQLTYLANAASRIYGEANPAFSGTVTGFKNADTLASVTAGTATFLSPANLTSTVAGGPYAINGSGLVVTTGNYQTTIVQAPFNATALTITPAQLFYQATPRTITYGDADPTLTGIIANIKNGEALATITAGTLEWTSTYAGNAGIYDITGAGLTVVSSNYLPVILQSPGNATALTVNQAQLFYVADKKTKVYGAPIPDLTGQVVGVAAGDTLEAVTAGTLVFTTTASMLSPAGYYPIDGSGLVVLNPNYVSTIAQDPGNAIALLIPAGKSAIDQAMQEGVLGQGSVFDQADGLTPSRDADLNIEGIGAVNDDMADDKNDEMSGQLCVLSVPEAARSPRCNKPGETQE